MVKECNEKEIDLLLGLLKGHISRQPESKEGFNAIRSLVDPRVAGAAEALADVLSTVPLSRMPGAVGMELQVLLRQRADLKPMFKAAIEKLRESPDTRIGKAFLEGEKG